MVTAARGVEGWAFQSGESQVSVITERFNQVFPHKVVKKRSSAGKKTAKL